MALPCKTDLVDTCVYGELTDSRDGQTYKTVTIGDQVWMAKNLNYETSASYCYNDDASNCVKYGRLYTWTAATMACPSGWHLPSTTEWEALFNAVGGASTAGAKFKSTSGWFDNGNGTDSFGFSAFPAGRGGINGLYSNEDNYASFWSSTEEDGYFYYMYGLFYNGDGMYLGRYGSDIVLSVRCLMN